MNTIHVEQPYFDYIRHGIKTVEGRVCKGIVASIVKDDVIKIACGDYFVTAYVKDVRKYLSFWHFLVCEGVAKTLPNIHNIDDACHFYNQLYSYEDMYHGVVALDLHIII
jgi:ASC-1-like (ASCH) protein